MKNIINIIYETGRNCEGGTFWFENNELINNVRGTRERIM